MYCSKCGKQVVEDSRYCSSCGAEVNVSQSTESVQPRVDSGVELDDGGRVGVAIFSGVVLVIGLLVFSYGQNQINMYDGYLLSEYYYSDEINAASFFYYFGACLGIGGIVGLIVSYFMKRK